MENPFAGEKSRKLLTDIGFDILGGSSIAIGVMAFSAPNQIAPGGANGVATLINYLFGLPIGTVSFFINLPLLIMAYKALGRRFTLRTLRAVAISTIMMDLVWRYLIPPYQGDQLLAALFAGAFSGIGSGLVFMRGSTTGGSDIVTKLILKKYPYISTGAIAMTVNGAVIIAAALVYGKIESALYGLIMTFASGRVIDAIIYGSNTGKYAMIVTHHPDEISRRIIKELHRGVTILDAKGAYNGQPTNVLMYVVRKQQFFQLKHLIHTVDPQAFVIITEANEILGRGFQPFEPASSEQ